MNIGDRVILDYPSYSLDSQFAKLFHGQRGEIIGKAKDGSTVFYRVRLDNPVVDPVAGLIEDDLWSVEYLKKEKTEQF